jgi:hypothetical protein
VVRPRFSSQDGKSGFAWPIEHTFPVSRWLARPTSGFAARWARHDVRLHHTARKRLANRVVGEIELTGDALDLAGDQLTMIAYSAAAGSQAEDQLKLLAAWSATARTPTSETASD